MTIAATFGRSVLNAVTPTNAQELNVSPRPMFLATTVLVFGFAKGPVLMGLAPELLGCKISILMSLGYPAILVLKIVVALRQIAQTVLTFDVSLQWPLLHHQLSWEDTLRTIWLPPNAVLMSPSSLT